ncbi:MAG: efflux RND transporter periplasmic adaptor subunit [Acetobacteraceae bacterium]|nr:efflux RND transporter periplasmic adaptor subunit [Acetobacteraceae bacterium]
MSGRWTKWIGALVVLAGGAAGAYVWQARRGAEVHLITAAVTRGAVTRTVTATGTVNPVLSIIIGTYVSGVIQELYCDYNTQVKKGQVCAKIDPRPYQSLVDQAKANLDVARAQLDKDRANLAYADVSNQRNAKLAAKDYTSQDTADLARSAFEQAKASVALDEASIAQRQAELAAAQVNLDYTDITSPVDGTVVSRNVTMGQTVAATFTTPTLFLIATDLTRMEVDTNVSESDIGAVKQGDAANFTVDAYANRVFQGAVVQVRQSPQSVQNVVTYDVVVGVKNTDLALMPGMTSSTQIVTETRADVLRVPDQALRYTPGGAVRSSSPRLYVLRDGTPVQVAVQTGLDDDSFTEILAGDVKVGDVVVIAEQGPSSSALSRP